MILTLENSHNKRQVGKTKIKKHYGLNIFVAFKSKSVSFYANCMIDGSWSTTS